LLTRAQKTELVKEFVEAFNDSPIIVFTDFKGLGVDESNELRQRLFKEYGDKAFYKVMRNSLLKTAIKQAGMNLEDYETFLEGSTAIFYIKEGDPISGLKVLTDFAKDHNELPAIKGGVLEGKIFDAERAEELSKLPSREELITMFVRGINAPISGLVNVLSGSIRNFINVLNSIKDEKS
jgi:large subunit ribosomal protein L10